MTISSTSMCELPFLSASAERNKYPILEVVQRHFPESGNILEIGSGTGQHAVYFASQMKKAFWQTSDLVSNHANIRHVLAQQVCRNVGAPLELDVGIAEHWERMNFSLDKYDGAYSANTAHIMPWSRVVDMFSGVSSVLKPSRKFLLYGPFNHNGEYTSLSNMHFDLSLSVDPDRGIRDDRDVLRVAEESALNFEISIDMPSNNRILVFVKSSASSTA